MFSRFIIVIALTLAGCSATGPIYKPAENIPEGEAVIYISREAGFGLGGRSAYFYVNEVNVFDLDQRGYSWVSLPSGHYKLRQSWPVDVMARSVSFEIDVKPGEVRYFSFGTGACSDGYRPGICISYGVQELPPDAGKAAIADKRFQENFGMPKLRQALGAK